MTRQLGLSLAPLMALAAAGCSLTATMIPWRAPSVRCGLFRSFRRKPTGSWATAAHHLHDARRWDLQGQVAVRGRRRGERGLGRAHLAVRIDGSIRLFGFYRNWAEPRTGARDMLDRPLSTARVRHRSWYGAWLRRCQRQREQHLSFRVLSNGRSRANTRYTAAALGHCWLLLGSRTIQEQVLEPFRWWSASK